MEGTQIKSTDSRKYRLSCLANHLFVRTKMVAEQSPIWKNKDEGSNQKSGSDVSDGGCWLSNQVRGMQLGLAVL